MSAKLSTDQALMKAKFHIKKDEMQEAKKLYQLVLQAFPKNLRAQQGLAILNKTRQNNIYKKPPQDVINQLVHLYNQKQFSVVVDQAEEITNQYPETFIVWNLLGACATKIGILDKAVNAYKKCILLKPNCAECYYDMGNNLYKQGKFNQATKVYKKCILIKPDFVDAYHNMGVALKDQGIFDEAIDAFNKALLLKPNYAMAYFNMGIALKKQGKFEEAITAYKEALSIKPDYADAFNNIGNILQDQGKSIEAITAYKEALSIKSDYPEAYNNMGNALKLRGKITDAIEAYKKALSLKPDYEEAWLNGAEALEQWNKIEQLELWLENAFQALKTLSSDIQILKVKLLWRNKEFKEASNLLSEIDFESITGIRKQYYLDLKAKYFEKNKDFDNAFNCFLKSNLLTKKSNNYLKANPEKYFQNLKNQLAKLKSIPSQTQVTHTTENDKFNPVFLVGFPRSGTTLLDTILRSHSKIEVVEEQPAVINAITFLKKNGYDYSANKIIPSELIAEAKKVYKVTFEKHIKRADLFSVNIDKLPLNLVKVHLIHQLYPQAKFILALRHPMDAILSCWIQNFKLNSAMANMVDLNRIVELYCVAMDIFTICRAKYSLSVHEIRYEDLLSDVSGETSTLLKFLDLSWESEMLNYRDTALKRGLINTPSYSQVVQPIYKDAKFRWLKYEKHLIKYLKQVDPWINKFGYSNTNYL